MGDNILLAIDENNLIMTNCSQIQYITTNENNMIMIDHDWQQQHDLNW